MRKELGENFVGLYVDPGSQHTGFVIVKVANDYESGPRFSTLSAGEVNGLIESAELLPYAISSFGVRLWCYEGFRLYNHMADTKKLDEFEEIQTIGAMRYAAHPFRQSLYVHKQFAHQIKVPPFGNKALQEMNAPAFASAHTRDAFRHFLVFWCHVLKFGYPKVVNGIGRPTPPSVD